MSCANDHYFLDTKEHDKTRECAKAGIHMPEQIKIERNSILYRVGHSNRDFETNRSSSWWMSDASFDFLRRQAGSAGEEVRIDRAFRRLFRNKLAVPHSFGLADVLVKVAVRQRLRAFTGRGGYVSENLESGESIGWIGGFEIAQYYIPGLRLENGSASPTCKVALDVLTYMPLRSFILSRQGS